MDSKDNAVVQPLTAEERPIPLSGILLGVLWLALPAVQYFGAVQRTEAVVNPTYAPGYLGSLDLGPFYMLLLGMTFIYAGLGALRRRSEQHAMAGSEEQ